MRSLPQGKRRSVDRGTCGPGIQPRKKLAPGCRRCKEKRKAASDASISRDAAESRDLLSQIFRKVLITDTQHIESNIVVQKLHLERLVRCDAWSGVQRDCVPGHLNPGRRNVVALKNWRTALALSTSNRSLSLLNFFSRRPARRCLSPREHRGTSRSPHDNAVVTPGRPGRLGSSQPVRWLDRYPLAVCPAVAGKDRAISLGLKRLQ
jgi:hypothetical protein